MRRSTTFLYPLLACLLVTSVLPVGFAASDPATDSQETQVKTLLTAAGSKGPTGNLATFDDNWEVRNEQQRLFLNGEKRLQHGGLPGRNEDPKFQHKLLGAGAADTPVLPGSPLIVPYGATTSDIEVSGFSTTLYVATREAATVVVQLLASTDQNITDADTEIARATVSITGVLVSALVPSTTGAPAAYSASASLAAPVSVASGLTLGLRISATSASATNDAFLHYGHSSIPSQILLAGDFARVNAWTEKNVGGTFQPFEAFPVPGASSAAERAITLRLTHGNGLGEPALSFHRHLITVKGPDGKVYYDNSLAALGPGTASTVNVANTQLWGAQNDYPADGTATGDGLKFTTYVMTYPAALEQTGVYTITVKAARGPAWTVEMPIVVGTAGSALALVAGEPALKEILVGERTTFRVQLTNTGGARDTFALGAQTGASPTGWAASASPAQITLSPGETVETVITVEPSSQGRNGDQNTIAVTATSLLSGTAKTLDATPLTPNEVTPLTVKLTSTLTTLAPSLLVPSSVISIGPGASRLIPVAVVNNGNGEDSFILSIQGAPTGWTVSANPALLELDAQSQGASVLRVEAPETAPRGQVFDLTLRASRVDDLAAKAEQVFKVQVFVLDKFTFLALDEAGALTALSSVTTPIVHGLRDEGPDAVVTASTSGPGGAPVGGSAGSTPWDGDAAAATSTARQDADADFDQSTLFRLVLSNEGDRADTIRVLPKLLTSTTGFSTDLLKQYTDGTDTGAATARANLGFRDVDGCEEATDQNSSGDGLNDGWRIRVFQAGGTMADMSATKQSYQDVAGLEIASINLPARSEKVVFVEMQWVTPDPSTDTCVAAASRVQGNVAGSRVGDPAPGHALAIEAISLNDPSQRNTHILNAKLSTAGEREASQRYQHQRNGVFVQPDGVEVTAKTVGAAARTATYTLRAVNTGNELDTLRITVPQCQGGSSATCEDGWFYDLPLAGVDHSLAFGNAFPTNPVNNGVPKAGECAKPAISGGQVAIECRLGSFDEVKFQVTARAPAGGALGTANTARVLVASKDSAAGSAVISDDLLLTTTLTGSFVFNLLPDAVSTAVNVQAGETAAVPFTLRNLGTNADAYNLDLAIAPPSTTGWRGDFPQANPLFVPNGKDLSGYLLITVPSGEAVNSQQNFRVRATSTDAAGSAAQDVFDIVATVVAAPTAFGIAGDPANVIAAPGERTPLTVKATRAAGATAADVTFRLDAASLPSGWTHTGAGPVTVAYDSNGIARATFNVTAPTDALGTSRAAVRVTGQHGTTTPLDFTFFGVALDVPSTGVTLESPNGNTILVAPGQATTIPLVITNLGIGLDRVQLAPGPVPTGWALALESTSVSVQPLQARTVNLTVTPPATLPAGEERLIRITATPNDATKASSLDLNFTTGTSVPILTPKSTTPLVQLPEEPFTTVITVLNNGTLGDDLVLGTALDSAFQDIVQVTFNPAVLDLAPGAAQEVAVTITLPAGLAPGTVIPVVLQASSQGPFLHAVGNLTLPVTVIDHKVRDVDGDLVNEYAVDRDLDPSNGYEAFRDPSAAGAASVAVDPAQLLSNEARARHTVIVTGADGNTTSVLSFLFDGDDDGKTDLLVDRNGDGIQDIYWDPDRGYSHVLPTAKDVTQDGRADDFIDLDGVNGLAFDVYYDSYEGVFGNLLQIDIDNNGQLDYVVDSNGNGRPDPAETVLFGGPDGTFVSIQEMRDVDGDGQLDTVIDSNGDGKPDYFIPFGKTAGVAIVLEDVNGDGIDDWTYDADGDGRRDSYFDPATGKTGLLNPKSNFADQLQEYWYIGALFGLVLVLFVVLMMVTRK